MHSSDWPLAAPVQNYSLGQFYGIDNPNALPQITDTAPTQITRPSISEPDDPSIRAPRSKLRVLLWPAFAITVPIALLSAALLGLVLGYRVRSEPSIFKNDGEEQYNDRMAYVLVDFSASEYLRPSDYCS